MLTQKVKMCTGNGFLISSACLRLHDFFTFLLRLLPQVIHCYWFVYPSIFVGNLSKILYWIGIGIWGRPCYNFDVFSFKELLWQGILSCLKIVLGTGDTFREGTYTLLHWLCHVTKSMETGAIICTNRLPSLDFYFVTDLGNNLYSSDILLSVRADQNKHEKYCCPIFIGAGIGFICSSFLLRSVMTAGERAYKVLFHTSAMLHSLPRDFFIPNS